MRFAKGFENNKATQAESKYLMINLGLGKDLDTTIPSSPKRLTAVHTSRKHHHNLNQRKKPLLQNPSGKEIFKLIAENFNHS